MKVFIVEDDFIIAESLEQELSKWNYEVIVAKQFDNIIDVFHANQPQLVLPISIYRHSMAITGVRRYVRLLMYRLCLLVQEPTIWIKLWQFKWAAMTLSRNHLIYR